MIAYVWMVAALCSFSLMAVGARELSGEIGTYQILSYRSLIGLIIITALIIKLKKYHCFKTKVFHKHGLRNAFHFLGQYGWFLGIGLLPLAEVFALEFTVPFWVLLIATIVLKEKLTLNKALAVVLGLLGVLLIVRLGIDIVSPASLIVLGAAMGYAVAHVTTKALTQTEHLLTILFYMCILQLPVALLLALGEWVQPTGAQMIWLVAIAVTALTANYSLAKAMQSMEVIKVVTVDFLRLPLIALIGVLFYNEPFNLYIIAGGMLMLIANIIQAKGVQERQ